MKHRENTFIGRRLANAAKGAGLADEVMKALKKAGIVGGVDLAPTDAMIAAAAAKFVEVSGSTNSVQAVRQIYKAMVDAS